MSVGQIDDFLIDDDVRKDRLKILDAIIKVYSEPPWTDTLMIAERGLEYSKRNLGVECYTTCLLSYRLAGKYNSLGRHQETLDLLHGMLDVSIRVVGPIEDLTMAIMDQFASANRCLGRKQEAFEHNKMMVATWEKSRNQSEDDCADRIHIITSMYIDLGRYEDAIELILRRLPKRKELLGEEAMEVLGMEYLLASAYKKLGRHQAALKTYRKSLKKFHIVRGEHDPLTLEVMKNAAVEYGCMGQPEKGIPLIVKALELGSKTCYDEDLENWEEKLAWLQSLSAERASHDYEEQSKAHEQQCPAVEETSGGKRSKFWQKVRHRIGESPIEEGESSKAVPIRQLRS